MLFCFPFSFFCPALWIFMSTTQKLLPLVDVCGILCRREPLCYLLLMFSLKVYYWLQSTTICNFFQLRLINSNCCTFQGKALLNEIKMNWIKMRGKNPKLFAGNTSNWRKALFNRIIHNPLKTALGLVLLEFISSLRACPQRKVRGKAAQNN